MTYKFYLQQKINSEGGNLYMVKKIIFLDVDGTLIDAKDDDRVIPSAIQAIQKARKNGHLVLLATGRSKPELYPHILDVGFDGIIGAGGGYIEYNNNVIFEEHVSSKNIKHLVDYFNDHNIPFYLESQGGLFGSSTLIPKLIQCFSQMMECEEAEARKHPFIECIQISENLYLEDVNKICFLGNPSVNFAEIEKEFSNEFNVLHATIPFFGDNSGELTLPNINKATAIDFLLHHISMSQQDTIAFGDGMNDVEMLQYCEIGIAMGNANPHLKEIANDITNTLTDDGIWKGFLKHGLILE